jgi:hypothetical protein
MNPGTTGNTPRIPLTIVQQVSLAGVQVGDDDLVNFGSMARQLVDPSQKYGFQVNSFWFKFGDIKHLRLAQVILAIGPGTAFAGLPGGVQFMRLSALPMSHFTQTPPTSGTGIYEYTIDIPVPIRQNIKVS